MINSSKSLIHWNYYKAIEEDLERVSRYIEFTPDNFNTYSIELAHIILSASSEFDVIMKMLCSIIAPDERTSNINDYRNIVNCKLPIIINEELSIFRFGLNFKPLENWNLGENPLWWRSYNKVKHQRNDFFNSANLKNAINSVGALMIATVYYYHHLFMQQNDNEFRIRETIRSLDPETSFIIFNSEGYYYTALLTE